MSGMVIGECSGERIYEINNEITLLSFQDPPEDFSWQDEHLKFNAIFNSAGSRGEIDAAASSVASDSIVPLPSCVVEVKCYWYEQMRTLRRNWNITSEEIEQELSFGPLVKAESSTSSSSSGPAGSNDNDSSFYSCRRRLKLSPLTESSLKSFNQNFMQYADYMNSRSSSKSGCDVSEFSTGCGSYLPKVINLVRFTFSSDQLSSRASADSNGGGSGQGQYYLVTVMPYPVLYNEMVHCVKVNCLPPKPTPVAKNDKESMAAAAAAANNIYYGELAPEHVSKYKPAVDRVRAMVSGGNCGSDSDSAPNTNTDGNANANANVNSAAPAPCPAEVKWAGRYRPVVDFPSEDVHVCDLGDEHVIKLFGTAVVKPPEAGRLAEDVAVPVAVPVNPAVPDAPVAAPAPETEPEGLAEEVDEMRPTLPSRHDVDFIQQEPESGVTSPVDGPSGSPESTSAPKDGPEPIPNPECVSNRSLVMDILRSDMELITAMQGFRFSLQVVVTKRLTEGLNEAAGRCFGPLLQESLQPSSDRTTLTARHDVDFAQYYDPHYKSGGVVDTVNPLRAAAAVESCANAFVGPGDTEADSAMVSLATDAAAGLTTEAEADAEKTVIAISEADFLAPRTQTPLPRVEVAAYTCYDALYPRLLPVPLAHTHDPTSSGKRRSDWEYYISFVDVFDSYELEDRMRKYTDIVSNIAKNYGKMPDRTYMRPDTYAEKLRQHLESDVFVVTEGESSVGKAKAAAGAATGGSNVGASKPASASASAIASGGSGKMGMSSIFSSLMKPKSGASATSASVSGTAGSTESGRKPPMARSASAAVGGRAGASVGSSSGAAGSKSFFSMFSRSSSQSAASTSSAETGATRGGMFRFNSNNSLSDKGSESAASGTSGDVTKSNVTDLDDFNYTPTAEELAALETSQGQEEEEEDEDYLHYRRGHV